MTRIWLNHWFSTAYHIINLIKEEEDNFIIIGSNDNDNSVIKCACDEWYQEPGLRGEEYAAYCLDFCKEHDIDVFIPRRGMTEISRNKKRFEQAGTRVMADDYEIVSVLNDKSKAYELFRKSETGIVPDYRIAATADEFFEAYNRLKEIYRQVCFKFTHDEGGRSFRIIDDSRKEDKTLFSSGRAHMALDDVMKTLKEKKSVPPIMVMPYLTGNEVSVDCLKTEYGLIMLPREKNGTRIEKLTYDEKILGMCRDIYEKAELEYPCNIQFKYLDGVPYFLEVNTRMSGGIQMACAASGVNIPNIAVNKILGISKKWELTKEEKFVSYVETPIIIQASRRMIQRRL